MEITASIRRSIKINPERVDLGVQVNPASEDLEVRINAAREERVTEDPRFWSQRES